MGDRLIRGVSPAGTIRAAAVTARDMVERARQIHQTLPLATAALGRALMAASMMGDDLKQEGASLTLQLKGDGPLGAITVVSDVCGNARGYLQNPAAELPLRADGKLNVGAGVGEGVLTVIKDLGEKEPFSGKIPLQNGEVAQDIAAYFAMSEQIPTVCALGVLVDIDQTVKHAGGYLIQLLPNADEETAVRLENRVIALPTLTAMLDSGLSMESILRKLIPGFQPSACHPVEYRCACSKERVERALISLGKQELLRLAGEQEQTEVTCQFCDRVYHFTKKELLSLIK